MSAFRQALDALQKDERLARHLQRAEQGRPLTLPDAMPFLLRLGMVGCLGLADLIDRLPAPVAEPAAPTPAAEPKATKPAKPAKTKPRSTRK